MSVPEQLSRTDDIIGSFSSLQQAVAATTQAPATFGHFICICHALPQAEIARLSTAQRAAWNASI